MNRQARTGPLAAPPGPAPGEAFGRAFDRLRDELVGTLSSVLHNADDAQDVAQETFLRCWRRRGRLDEVHNLRAWAFRVALNAATDLRRSAWRRRARPLPGDDVLTLEDEAPGPGAGLDEQDRLARLRAALTRLRPEEREVFLLRQNGDLTYGQIAALHDRPLGTVKTQMRSAVHKLRQALAT
jgi:RNA polymerase sigma-70 factor (ECF subfamily)